MKVHPTPTNKENNMRGAVHHTPGTAHIDWYLLRDYLLLHPEYIVYGSLLGLMGMTSDSADDRPTIRTFPKSYGGDAEREPGDPLRARFSLHSVTRYDLTNPLLPGESVELTDFTDEFSEWLWKTGNDR